MKFGRVVDEELHGDLHRLVEPMCVDPRPEFKARPYNIPEGFETDFASMPLLFKGIWGTDTEKPAVMHDWHCVQKDIPRSEADARFREGLKAEGIWWHRRWLMWMAVRLYGMVAR